MANIKKPASEIKVGDVIMPPPGELSPIVRRTAKARGMSAAALYWTVIAVCEGTPDLVGRWVVIHARYSEEWAAGRVLQPTFFIARPETKLTVISRDEPCPPADFDRQPAGIPPVGLLGG